MLAMGGVYSVFILIGGNVALASRFSNPDLATLLLLTIPHAIVGLPAGLLAAVLVTSGEVKRLSVFNVVSNTSLGLVVIGVCIYWPRADYLVSAYVLVHAIFGFIAILLILRASPLEFRKPEFKKIKILVSYSLPLGIATILGSLTIQLDKIIVSSTLSPVDFAIYSNGAIEIPLIGIVTGAISTIILSEMSANCKAGLKERALDLFRKAAVRSGIIIFPAMAFLLVYAHEFITLIFSDKYQKSVDVFVIYLLALPVRIVMYGAALMALNMTKFILYRSIFDLLINALLSVILINIFGVYGAAVATIITLFIWTVPVNIKMIAKGFGCGLKDVMPIKTLLEIAVISFLAAIFCVVVSGFLAISGKLSNLIVGFILFGGSYACMAFLYIAEARDVFQFIMKGFKRLV